MERVEVAEPEGQFLEGEIAVQLGHGQAVESDLPRALQILKQSRYRGTVSIEYGGNEDALEGVRHTLFLIQKHWQVEAQ